MIKAIMRERLMRLLENERTRPVRKVLALEERLPAQQLILGDQTYRCKYVIDRVDELPDSSILVIDYKTGSAAKEPAGLSSLLKMELDREAMRQTIHSFQLPLYCYFARKRYPSRRVNAALYNLREIECRYFIKPDKLDTADEVMDICLQALAQLLGEIMNPDCAFAADKSNERACGFCEFRAMCA
jgi:ATP-dependent exoDNAse (exonuclease V) beta subunit